MPDGLFFCATLTDHRGGHTPFVQAGADTPVTGADSGGGLPRPTLSVSHTLFLEGHSRRVVGGDGDENAESCRVVRMGGGTFFKVGGTSDR